jgi:hypothetical protein
VSQISSTAIRVFITLVTTNAAAQHGTVASTTGPAIPGPLVVKDHLEGPRMIPVRR